MPVLRRFQCHHEYPAPVVSVDVQAQQQTVRVPEDDPDGMHLTDDVRLAMLMLVSHFYENRSTITDVEKLETPMSFRWLAGPYRIVPL